MTWLYIAILAYFLIGAANLGDKLVVSKYLSSAKVYAITVALLQAIVVLFLPFFGEWPGWQNLFLDFAAGAVFVGALYLLFFTLKTGEVSAVVPAIDGLIPIAVLFLSFLILNENFSQRQCGGIILLIAGGLLLTIGRKLSDRNRLKYVIITAAMFALSQVLAKITYLDQPFLSAFIWARLGAVIAIIPFLFFKTIRNELKTNYSQKSHNSKAVLIAQICGGAGGFLQNYAIKLGDVAAVSAVQGIKYLFLFILIFLFSKKFPRLKERWDGKAMVRRLGGAALVGAGLVVLVI